MTQRRLILLAVIASSLVAMPAGAAVKDWNDGSDNWSVAANWTPAGVPGASDVVKIVFSDGLERTVAYDYTGPAVTLDSLSIDLTNAGANASTLTMSANTLSALEERIGVDGVGTFNQSGGFNLVNSNGLTLGYGSTGMGTYNLSDGTLSAFDTNVGLNGQGVFTQTGGKHVLHLLSIGSMSAAKGTYTLSAGFLQTSHEIIGVLATGSGGQSGGVFTQTGGTNFTGGIAIADGAGSTGSYTLSGGALTTSSGGTTIGSQGTGSFVQTGGSFTTVGINLGPSNGSSGSFLLSGGIATASGISLGGSFCCGGGTGVMTVSGTNTVLNVGTIQVNNTSGSVFNLQSGTVNVGEINVGGFPSLFSWTGGTLNITNDVTWDSGGYPFSTSTVFGSSLSLSLNKNLKVTGNETIGGNGVFNLSVGSGTHAVTGGITLKPGGTLTATNSSVLVYDSFTQAGGSIVGTFRNTGNFIHQSGSITAQFINSGTVSFGSSMSISSSLQNEGTITVGGGQTLSVTSTITNSGNLTLNGGTISGSSSFTNAAGGTITAHGTINHNITNQGTLIADGSLFMGALTNTGILQGIGTLSYGSNIIQNNAGGVINATTPGGTLALNFTLANNAGATVNIGPTSTFSVAQGWTNSGIVNLQGTGARLSGGTFTNNGTLQGFGTITASLATSNNGVFRASGGELIFTSNTIANSSQSQVQVLAGATVMYLQGMLSISGTISLMGGTFDNNNRPIQNFSTINGHGVLRTGGLTNTTTRLISVGGGDMDVLGSVINSGIVSIQSGRSAYFFGPVSGSGSFTGTGTAVFLASLSPGSSPALVSFAGNVTLGTSLAMELGGTTAGSGYDKIDVEGLLSVGGQLSVSLIGGFTPSAGNQFDLLDWGTLNGTFSSLQLPGLGSSLEWDTTQIYTSGVLSVVSTLPGDYNGNGSVDAADYVLFRKGGPLANEVDTPGTVNAADYDEWRARFGNPGSGAAAGSSHPFGVPEPTNALLFALGVTIHMAVARSIRRSRVD